MLYHFRPCARVLPCHVIANLLCLPPLTPPPHTHTWAMSSPSVMVSVLTRRWSWAWPHAMHPGRGASGFMAWIMRFPEICSARKVQRDDGRAPVVQGLGWLGFGFAARL